MKLPSGLKILEDQEGSGDMAETGHTVVYNCRIFLNQGDEAHLNGNVEERGIPEDRLRQVDGVTLIDHISVLGKRQVIAGIEKALVGMRAGGFRKIRVAPHLAYRDRGIPGMIPPNAVLTVLVWLRDVVEPHGG